MNTEKRGGANRGQGRKPLPASEKKQQKLIRLYPWQLEKLKTQGLSAQQAIDKFIEGLH